MIKQATNHNLLQLKFVLEQINNNQFSSQLDVLNGSTIGMHVRHVLEFYNCLIHSKNTSQINYDHRKRDALLEVSVDECVKTISKILVFLDEIESDFDIKLSANYSTQNESENVVLSSTFYRELLYNVEHTVHHFAIIKIGLKAIDANLKIDNSFGVAASTIRNNNLCAQ
jgi:hypothetical protein